MAEEEYYPSEIARLVLGYLQEVNCTQTWQTFLSECHYLEEPNRLFQQGKILRTKIEGQSLLEILHAYCFLKKGTEKHANLNRSSVLNSGSEVFKTPGKNNQHSFTKYRIYQKSRTQQVTASPTCEQNDSRLAKRVVNASCSPMPVSSPKSPGRFVRVHHRALSFGKDAQSTTKNGHASETQDISSLKRKYRLSFSPGKNSIPMSSRTPHSDPVSKPQSKVNKTVLQSDSLQSTTADGVHIEQSSVEANSHDSPIHDAPSENANSNFNNLIDCHSEDKTLTTVNSGQKSLERTNPVFLTESVDQNLQSSVSAEVSYVHKSLERTDPVFSPENAEQNSQSSVLNQNVLYQTSEITSTDKSVNITTSGSSLTPQHLTEPPAYYRAPSTNSPRLILSHERSQISSLTTPQKDRSFEDSCASPRRKGFIPRRRLLGDSPLPKNLQNDPAPCLNICYEELTFLEEFSVPDFAQTIADEINNVNSCYPSIQDINESERIKNISSPLVDKFLDFFNNKAIDGNFMTDCNATDFKKSHYSSKEKNRNDEMVTITGADHLCLPPTQSSDSPDTNPSVLNLRNDNGESNLNPNLLKSVLSTSSDNAIKIQEKLSDASSVLHETHNDTALNNKPFASTIDVDIDTDTNNQEIGELNGTKEADLESLKQKNVMSSNEQRNPSEAKMKTDSCSSSDISGFNKEKISSFFNNMEKDLSSHTDINSLEAQNHSLVNNSMETVLITNSAPNISNETSHNQSIILDNSNQVILNSSSVNVAPSNSVLTDNSITSSVNLVAQSAPNFVQSSSYLPTQTIFLPPLPAENFQNNLQYQLFVNPATNQYFLPVPSVPSLNPFQVSVPPLSSVSSGSKLPVPLIPNSYAGERQNSLESVANYVTISPTKSDEIMSISPKLEKSTKPASKATKKAKRSNRKRKNVQPRKAAQRKTQVVAEKVYRNLRSRNKLGFSEFFSSPLPVKSAKVKKTKKITENQKTDKEPVLLSIPEPSPSNRSALELFSEVTGEREMQSPVLRSLISSAKVLIGEGGGRLKSPHVRVLNFESSKNSPDISPTQRRSSSRSRSAATRCCCDDDSPSKSATKSEAKKTCGLQHKVKKSLAKTFSGGETQVNTKDDALIDTELKQNDDILLTTETELLKSTREKENMTIDEVISIQNSVISSNTDLLSMPKLSRSKKTKEKHFNETSSSPISEVKSSLNEQKQKGLSTPNVKHLDRDSYFPQTDSESENEKDVNHVSSLANHCNQITAADISVQEEVNDTLDNEMDEDSSLKQCVKITETESTIETRQCRNIMFDEDKSNFSQYEHEIEEEGPKQKETDSAASEYKTNAQNKSVESLFTNVENFDDESVSEQTLALNDSEGTHTASTKHNSLEASDLNKNALVKICDEDKTTTVHKNSDNLLISNAISEVKVTNENSSNETRIKNDTIHILNKTTKLKTPDKNTGEVLHSIVSNIVTKRMNEIDLMAQNNTKILPIPQRTDQKMGDSARRITAPPKKRIRPVQISSPNDPSYLSNSPFFPPEDRCPLDLPTCNDVLKVTHKDLDACSSSIERSVIGASAQSKTSEKLFFHSTPISGNSKTCLRDFNVSASCDTQKIILKESIANILPVDQNKPAQLKTPQKYPFHSIPLSGKPKAMAEFYRKNSKNQNSAFPISPGSVSSSSCTLDTFIVKQQTQQENTTALESKIKSPIKKQYNSEEKRDDASLKKQTLANQTDISINPLMVQFTPKKRALRHDIDMDSCSPVISAKRKHQTRLNSSPEVSPQHAASKKGAQKPEMSIDNGFQQKKTSACQLSPVRSIPEVKNQSIKSKLCKNPKQNPHLPAGVKIPSNWKQSKVSSYSADVLKFAKKQHSKPASLSFKKNELHSVKPFKKSTQKKKIADADTILKNSPPIDKKMLEKNEVNTNATKIVPESCSSPELPSLKEILAAKDAGKAFELASKANEFMCKKWNQPAKIISPLKTLNHSKSKKKKKSKKSSKNVLEKCKVNEKCVDKASVAESPKTQLQKLNKISKLGILNKCEKAYPLKRSATSEHCITKRQKVYENEKLCDTKKFDVNVSMKDTFEHEPKKGSQTNTDSNCNTLKQSENDSLFKRKSISHSVLEKTKKDIPSKTSSKQFTSNPSKDSRTYKSLLNSESSSKNYILKDSSQDPSKRNLVACHSSPDQRKADDTMKNAVKRKDFLLKKSSSEKKSLLKQHKRVRFSILDINKDSKHKKKSTSGGSLISHEMDALKLDTAQKTNKITQLTKKIDSDELVSKEAAENLVRISQEEKKLKESESAMDFYDEDNELDDTELLERTAEDEDEIASAIAFLHESQKEKALENQPKLKDFDASLKESSSSKFDFNQDQREIEKFNVNKIAPKTPSSDNNSSDLLVDKPRTETNIKSKGKVPSRTLSKNGNNIECDSGKLEIESSDHVPHPCNAEVTKDESSVNVGNRDKLQLLMDQVNRYGIDHILDSLLPK